MAQIQPLTTYEYLLYTTVRLEISIVDDTKIGTGFLYDHHTAGGEKIPLLITNRHVVAGCQSVAVRFHRRDTSAPRWAVSGYVDLSLPILEAQWTGHPDPAIDLSAIRLSTFQQAAAGQGNELGVFALGERFIPDDFAAFDAVEDVIMLGYPSGLWDSTNNYPIVRRGITASHPGVDFEGQPQFAVDIACFEGSSGSPVLLPYDPGRAKPVAFFDPTRLFAFLGVLSTLHRHPVEGELLAATPTPIPTQSLFPMNLGYAIKAREVVTLARHLEATSPQSPV
jgi:hypothetical protein